MILLVACLVLGALLGWLWSAPLRARLRVLHKLPGPPANLPFRAGNTRPLFAAGLHLPSEEPPFAFRP